MIDYEFKKMQIGNEILAYRECGKGDKVLLLVHGNMSSSMFFDELMEALEDDYKMYAVDLRGFGQSSYHERFDSLTELSEDLEVFVDKLRLKDFEMLGWSTGGGIVMQFAADNPELVKRLILVESVGIKGYPIFKKNEKGEPILTELCMTKEEIANDPIQVAPVLNAIANKDKAFYKALWDGAIFTEGHYPSPEKYDMYIEEMLLQRNLVDIDYSLTRFNISNQHNGYSEGSGAVEKIKCHVDIIEGKGDLVVPMEMAQGINEGLKCSKKLHLLENSAHNPMVDSLDKLVAIIKEF